MTDDPRNDEQLLRAFGCSRDEQAFSVLVRRHLELVHGTAFRLLRDRMAAEEVTQNVFLGLARKAGRLSGEGGLAGWLHRAAVLEARQRQRTEARRNTRERSAGTLGTTMGTHGSPDHGCREGLDEALLELGEGERRTVFLRYFEGKSLREVGEALGIGEGAAQKRLERALLALARVLGRRGWAGLSAGGLARTLEAAVATAAETAPASLAGKVARAVLQAAATPAEGWIAGLLSSGSGLGCSTTQVFVTCAVLVAVPVGLQWRATSLARDQLGEARGRYVALAGPGAGTESGVAPDTGSGTGADPARMVDAWRERRRRAVPPATTSPAWVASWSEADAYVRIPKAMASHLRFAGTVVLPGTEPPLERVLDPVDGAGNVSASLSAALGLDEAERAGVQAAVARVKVEVRDTVTAGAYLTNWIPPEFGAPAREARDTGRAAWTLVTPPLPDNGVAIREGFQAELDRVLGADRAEVLWGQAAGMVRRELGELGAKARVETVVLKGTDERLVWWSGMWGTDGRMSEYGNASGVGLERLPEPLRVLVEERMADHGQVGEPGKGGGL
jgi:RNA polymerase sigma factor (sigma-70 family)